MRQREQLCGLYEQGWEWKDSRERFWRHLECRAGGTQFCTFCLNKQSPNPQLGLHRILSLERILQGYLAQSPASGRTNFRQTARGSWLLLVASRNNNSISHCKYLSESNSATQPNALIRCVSSMQLGEF